jgi:septal ring factor EnvC (AmiA/AmiB activator)|eukprot:COSAG02_NODE_3708_length_6351_cov_1.684101_9_plen_102_part_00
MIAGLKSDIKRLSSELEEAARVRAALEAELARTRAESEKMRGVLEEKDDEGRTLLERLEAMEERHKVDMQRLVILQNQYTQMVATFSEKDLLSTPAAASGA